MDQLEEELFTGGVDPYESEGGGPDDDDDDDESGGPKKHKRHKRRKPVRRGVALRRRPKSGNKAMRNGRLPVIMTKNMTLRQSPFGYAATVAASDFQRNFQQSEGYNPVATFITSGTSAGTPLTLTLIPPTADSPVLVAAFRLMISASVTILNPEISVTMAVTANLQGMQAATLGGSYMFTLADKVRASSLIMLAYSIVNGKPVSTLWLIADDWVPFTGVTAFDSSLVVVLTGLPTSYTAQLHCLTRQAPEGIRLLAMADAAAKR